MSLSLAGDGTITGFDAGLSGFGGLVAVETVVKTDTQSASLAAGASTAITGLTISHAVADAANKVILIAQISGGRQSGVLGAAITAGGTALNLATSPGNRIAVSGYNAGPTDSHASTVGLNAVYAPGSTGSVTYGAVVYNVNNATSTVYVNRSTNDSNAADRARSACVLTLLEVKV